MNHALSSAGGNTNPDAPRPVTLRISSASLMNLQLLAAEIRYQSGKPISCSAIVRSLIQWMSECALDPREISSPRDLQALLGRTLGSGKARRRAALNSLDSFEPAP